jgi:hypothetical protein
MGIQGAGKHSPTVQLLSPVVPSAPPLTQMPAARCLLRRCTGEGWGLPRGGVEELAQVRQKLNRHTSVGALGMTSAAPCPRSSVPPLCSVYATNSGRWCCHDEANYDYLLEFLIGDVRLEYYAPD